MHYQFTVSDFHLGEGVLYDDGNLNPLEDFHHDKDFYKLLTAINKKYERHNVSLNLLGDTFDPRQVRLEGKLVDPPHEEVALYKIKKIIDGHLIFFEALRFWISSGRSINIFIGNHDAMLAWPKIQLLLKEIISPENPSLVEFLFEMIHQGSYFAHGNFDLFSRLNREKLFTESSDERKIMNMPDDSLFHMGVVNPLKTWNKYVTRMAQHRHLVLFRDAIFRNWSFVYLAATCWLKVLLKSVLGFLMDTRFDRWTRFKNAITMLASVFFQSFWNAVFGDNLERDAKRILKSKKLDAVILGHTHGCILKAIGGSWYANTGTWSMRFVLVPRTGFKRLWIFSRPIIERQDKLTYVITRHDNGKTVSVQLKEFVPDKSENEIPD